MYLYFKIEKQSQGSYQATSQIRNLQMPLFIKVCATGFESPVEVTLSFNKKHQKLVKRMVLQAFFILEKSFNLMFYGSLKKVKYQFKEKAGY